ncbi:MAG: TlpA family protein disulfide reductase [Burkholderiales bacterium]|nr:TlpA family protein disulfide reductase [Burkholderiales bacterium]
MKAHGFVSRRAAMAGLALSAAAGSARAEPSPRPWPRGQATPALALPGQDGGSWTLASARGQVVLLNFWASWCEPCRTEMPSLELLAQRHEKDRLQVLAINFRETDSALRRFVDQWPVTLSILRDRDGAAAQACGVRVFPTTLAVGRDGRIAFSVVGEVEWTGADARRWLAPLL